jgi:hypothetical protein
MMGAYRLDSSGTGRVAVARTCAHGNESCGSIKQIAGNYLTLLLISRVK